MAILASTAHNSWFLLPQETRTQASKLNADQPLVKEQIKYLVDQKTAIDAEHAHQELVQMLTWESVKLLGLLQDAHANKNKQLRISMDGNV